MNNDVQKGCVIGCLSALGALAVAVFAICVLTVVALRGCFSSVLDEDGESSSTIAGGERPQDEDRYRKVWLSGKGGKDAADVLKIRLHGVMLASERRNLFDATEDTGASAALRKIRAAIRDVSIRGLYLDIDSPGGGVTIADEIHDAVEGFRRSDTNRFVFVHMGDLCCSGGYYVAAAATWIMARPTTLTGSIGVVMNSVNLAGLAGKIGIDGVTIASGENKDLLNPLKPVKQEHVEILERPLRQMHERFVNVVAKGRGLAVDAVRPLADGRVFSAEDALGKRLVDGIGHEDDAMLRLKRLAGGNVRIYGYREKQDFRSILANSFFLESADGMASRLKAAIDDEATPRAEYRMR